MDERKRQANRLAARAEALEQELASVILELDQDAVARLAEAALGLGFTEGEVERLFKRSIETHLETAFRVFGEESVANYGLPPAQDAVRAEADQAIRSALKNLSDEAEKVIYRLTDLAQRQGWGVYQLASEIRDQIVLTDKQNAWVSNFERKLRTDPRKALENKLRDRRSDRSLLSGDELSESQIQSMVRRYRDRWVKRRSFDVARTELLRASNGAHFAAFENAENQGALPWGARKFWWHMHDSHVRHSHVEIPILNPDGVPIGSSFVTPLGTLRYPLDPLGVAADVIGCRCLCVIDTANPEGAT